MCKWRILRTIFVTLLFSLGSDALAIRPMKFRTFNDNMALCDQGYSSRCVEVADRYRAESLVNTSRKKDTYETYKRACQMAHGLACREAAKRMLEFDVRSADDIVLENARQCSRGVVMNCFLQAMVYLYQPHKLAKYKKDEQALGEKAGSILMDACKQGLAQACTEMGMILYQAGQAKQAEVYLRRSCAMGDPYACSYGGVRDLLISDTAAAAELYAVGCKLLEANSCYFVGAMLETLKKPEAEEAAMDQYLYACELGIMRACMRAATPLIKSDQLKEAAEILGYPCTANDGEACLLLARIRKFQYASPEKEYDLAIAHLTAGCAQGEADQCRMKKTAIEESKAGRISWFFTGFRYKMALFVSRLFKRI